MIVFFYKELTRKTKFGTGAFNKMLLNAAKCQRHSFYRFFVIKGKPSRGVWGWRGGGGKITPRDPDYGKRDFVLSSDFVPFVHLFGFDVFVLCCKSSYFFPF